MIPALKAEFRKLFTVRSTYFIVAFVALFVMFFAGYIDGFKVPQALLAHDTKHVISEVTNALSFAAVFCGLIAILLFSHEYRYNTIMHSLTSTNSRSKVLLAKILVMTGFAAVFALFMGVLSPLVSYAGIHLAGHELVAQQFVVSELLWRGLFFVWGYAMIGLLFVALTRNQVFSIVAIFFIPITVEAIATLLLKTNAIYLPFTALNAVIMPNPHLTHQKAVLVFLTWLVSSWATAWFFFLYRDASTNRG